MAVLRALERCYLRLPSLGNNTAMIAKASLKVKISRERSVKVLRVCTCLHLRRHPCAHAHVNVCFCELVCATGVPSKSGTQSESMECGRHPSALIKRRCTESCHCL